MEFPRISVVTPSFNKAPYLEASIRSVLDQHYPNLEYIIIDGGSTDGSVEIIRKYAEKISYWISEPDSGIYHALEKGFSRTSGEIMGWLNADDILHTKALFTIGQVFEDAKDVDWLQGHPTVIDETGRIVYNRVGINNMIDFYRKRYHDGNFIQQESTYWRRSLWNKAGNHISRKFKFAGDFELWMRFFNHAKLYNTSAIIGAFRIINSGQLSSLNYNAYLTECNEIVDFMIQQLDPEIVKLIKQKSPSRLFGRKAHPLLSLSPRVEYHISDRKFHEV